MPTLLTFNRRVRVQKMNPDEPPKYGSLMADLVVGLPMVVCLATAIRYRADILTTSSVGSVAPVKGLTDTFTVVTKNSCYRVEVIPDNL